VLGCMCSFQGIARVDSPSQGLKAYGCSIVTTSLCNLACKLGSFLPGISDMVLLHGGG